MERAIIIFSRIPIPGKTKTRMMPFLTAEECADIHRCFIKDIYISCKKVMADTLVCYAPEGELQELKMLLDENLEYYEQYGANLGIRMKHAFERAFEMGYKKVLLVGTDVPQLTEEILEKGFKGLDENDIVIHPTVDGGYYLIAMKEAHDVVWNVKKYGTNTVIEDTLTQVKIAGLHIHTGTVCRDMDTKEDLYNLYQELHNSSDAENTKEYLNMHLKNRW